MPSSMASLHLMSFCGAVVGGRARVQGSVCRRFGRRQNVRHLPILSKLVPLIIHRYDRWVVMTTDSSKDATTLSRMNFSGYLGHVTIFTQIDSVHCISVVYYLSCWRRGLVVTG